MELEQLARQYFDEVRKNEFSRLRAWEFIYAYTRVDNVERLVSSANIEKTGLHLGLYLAQWGMFRGSGHLIDQNLNYFMHMSNFFFKEIPDRFPEFYSHTFSDFSNKIFCKEFDDTIDFIRSDKLMMNPSDTLISKILLGVWGHVPAFDTQFKESVSIIFQNHYKLPVKCNSSSLCLLEQYCREINLDQKTDFLFFSKNDQILKYPLAKKLDMALWIKSKK